MGFRSSSLLKDLEPIRTKLLSILELQKNCRNRLKQSAPDARPGFPFIIIIIALAFYTERAFYVHKIIFLNKSLVDYLLQEIHD